MVTAVAQVAAVAQIQSLAQELPHAEHGQKKKKKTEKLNTLLLSTCLQNQAPLSSLLDIFKGLEPSYIIST